MELTPRNRILLAQLIIQQAVKNFPRFMEPGGALPLPVAILSQINPVRTPPLLIKGLILSF